MLPAPLRIFARDWFLSFKYFLKAGVSEHPDLNSRGVPRVSVSVAVDLSLYSEVGSRNALLESGTGQACASAAHLHLLIHGLLIVSLPESHRGKSYVFRSLYNSPKRALLDVPIQ